jgi:hypothetical protein
MSRRPDISGNHRHSRTTSPRPGDSYNACPTAGVFKYSSPYDSNSAPDRIDSTPFATQEAQPFLPRRSYPPAFHGFNTTTSIAAKSLTLRVTTVNSCSSAVAPMNPSRIANGVPRRCERDLQRDVPRFQLEPPLARGQQFHSPANLCHREHADEQTFFVCCLQPSVNPRICGLSPRKFGKNVGVDQKAIHNSIGPGYSFCLSISNSEPAKGLVVSSS